MLDLDRIRHVLQTREHEPATFEAGPNHAAVAMILAGEARALEVCFIRRAEREGDPWTGQVAFPGGRAGREDPDAHAVAERETYEEIGLRLDLQHRVAPLPVRPNVRGSLTLSPFVYHVDGKTRSQAVARLPDEVASVFWVPLAHLFDQRAVTEIEYPSGLTGSVFPGIRFGEHVIWGLTLRVLQSFAQVLQLRLPALDD